MRKPARLAAAALAALLLPGCYVIHSAVPLDASGMAYPIEQFSDSFAEQVEKTKSGITGLPRWFERHCAKSWRDLMEDPAIY